MKLKYPILKRYSGLSRVTGHNDKLDTHEVGVTFKIDYFNPMNYRFEVSPLCGYGDSDDYISLDVVELKYLFEVIN